MNRSKQLIISSITLVRIIGIPFIFMISNKYILFVYASILFMTDFIDGQLARKWDLCSTKGALLDLIADKLLVLVLFLSASINQQLPYWVFFLIAFREIVSMIMRQIKLSKANKLIKANMIGKSKTALQFIALGMMILQLPYYMVVVYIMLIVSYISFIMYCKEFFKK